MNFDVIMSRVKDYHLPICLFMFIVGSVMKWFNHLDMAYVAYAGTIIGGITGHAFSDAVSKDRKSTRLNSSHTEQSRMPSSA